MNFAPPKWLVLLSASANAVLFYLLYKLSDKPPAQLPAQQPTPPTEVLFFPDDGFQCPRLKTIRGCLEGGNCKFMHTPQSLARLVEILRSATVSLDVCMFVICSEDLIKILVDLHKSGVRVRCISDNQDMDGALKALRGNGILIRFDRSDYLMHHKFVIIDSRTVLTGSYNFSRGGMGINRENLVAVHFPHIVQAYQEEFDGMWNIYGTKKFSYNFQKDVVYQGTG